MTDPVTTPRTTSWVDVVVPVLLTAVVLSALAGSFANNSYLSVGAVGAVMATTMVTVAWTQHRKRSELLLALLVLFAPLGALVSRHDGDVITIPGVTSMVDVITAAFTGPGELLHTIPPADAAGAPLALNFILGYVVAGSCATLAMFGRHPVFPALPATVGLVVTVLLGVQNPAGIALRAAALAALVLVWIAARSNRHLTVSHDARGVIRRGVASVAVVAVVSSLIAASTPTRYPADEHQRWVLRGRVGGGEDVSRLNNPLSDFRRFTRQLPGTPGNVYNEKLFEVEGLPPQTPMRFVTLDDYDGTRWHTGNRTVPGTSDALFLRIGSEVAAPLPGRSIEVKVQLRKGYMSSWLPLAGQLTGVDFTYFDGRAQREDVRYNLATLTAMVRGGLVRKDDYEFSAVLPRSVLKVGMSPYSRGRNQPDGRFLDEAVEPWRKASLSPMERVFNLAAYLRTNGRFSDGAQEWERQFLPGHDRDRLGLGFFEAPQMVGDAEQYTAFMALAANRLGVPARVAVGAVPSAKGVVKGSDVTTWVEVRVEDGSWRIMPSELYVSTRPPRRTDPPKQDPGAFVQAAEKEQAKKAKPPPPEVEREPLEDLPAKAESPVPKIVLGALGVVALIGSVPWSKWWRRRRRRTAGSTGDQASGAWDELLDLLRDLGYDVAWSLPRPMQAAALGRAEDAARLADGTFALVEPTAETVQELWAMIDGQRQELLAEHGVAGRLRAWWSPASLSLSGNFRQAVRRALSTPVPREGKHHDDDDVLVA